MYARRRFEPYIRDLAIRYLEERFDSQVEFASLQVQLPGFSDLRQMARGRVVLLTAQGSGLSIRHMGRTDIPPMFKLQKFNASVDLNTLYSGAKIVPLIVLDGMEITVPPKGERPNLGSDDKDKPKRENSLVEKNAQPETKKKGSGVVVQDVLIRDAKLVILPRDPSRIPLKFDLYDIHLHSAAVDIAMKYEAFLTNPKPKGEIHSTGTFGPWNAESPSDSPLNGDYLFENADLGVFNRNRRHFEIDGTFRGGVGGDNSPRRSDGSRFPAEDGAKPSAASDHIRSPG